ncbi:MAG: ABC transporter substrate-binding protein [Chloroflexota bacterium]
MAKLTMAVGTRLETKYLVQGRVKVEGFDVEVYSPGFAPAPIFPSMVTTRPYDVGELTITNFIVAKDNGVGLIGLPVFPNLFYPLTGVTVHTGAGINAPQDLAGKRIGVPLGFASNPAAWLRGILVHQFDVSAECITWVEGEADSLRDIPYPRSKRYTSEKRAKLEDALAAGEIDALVVAGGNAELAPTVRRLTEDANPLIADYFTRTGAMPINTLLVMKEESHAANPGLAEEVVAASVKARALYDAEEPDSGEHQGLNVGAMRKLGIFPRHHGLDSHGASVRAIATYLYEQGLTKRLWTVEELFV